MSKTALQLVQAACYGANITPPSALVGDTASSTLQLLELFYETGRELLKDRHWAQLRKSYTIFLQPHRSQYQLPQDFYSTVPGTRWDRGNVWQMLGPVGDRDWSCRVHSGLTGSTRAYREGGPFINPNDSRGQLEINPRPGDSDHDVQIPFEYISRSWLMPKSWASGGTVGASDYVNCSGNIYSHTVGTTNGTVPPNMATGIGQDGGVFWLALAAPTAYTVDTVVAAGEYFTSTGSLYQAVIGGTTSGGPSGTTEETDITDGTVTWRYHTSASWTGQTDFEEYDHIKIASQYYRCVSAGKTGKVSPTWTPTTVSDGTITWTHYTGAYETLLADTDLCLFDDELMVRGLQWRFMRARGLTYEPLKADYEKMKLSESGRLNAGRIVSAAGCGGGVRYPSLPESFEF